MANTCLGDTYVELIERTECIGNSLAKINSNFAALDIRICEGENTTSALNSVQGIVKGNGAGEFEAADPDVDYYVPGRMLYSDFNVSGAINCGGTVTIGGTGNLVVSQGKVSCTDVNASGTATIIGAANLYSTLDVKEKGTFAGQIASKTLSVTDSATFGADVTIGNTLTTSALTVTNSIQTSSINATISVQTSAVNATTLNLAQPTSVATITKQIVGTSIVDALTAYDGIFIGSKVQALSGIFGSLTIVNGTIPTLGSTTLTCPTINGTTITAKTININDDGLVPGTINTNVANITTANVNYLNINNVVNGNNIGTITAAIGNIATINSTNLTGTIVTAVNQFTGPIGNITTLNTTTGNITNVAATTINASTTISGKKLSITGTGANEGTIDATVSISAPTITATGVSGVVTPKLTVSGSIDAIVLNSNSAQIVMNQPSSVLNMTGLNSQINLNSGTITAANVYATSVINCKGDVIAYGALSDKRLKKNITKIENGLDKISSLRGVIYDWDTNLQSLYSGEDVGVIAQEVREVLPQAVCERENGHIAVKYEKLIPLLIEAVKELKEQNIALREEIEALKTK